MNKHVKDIFFSILSIGIFLFIYLYAIEYYIPIPSFHDQSQLSPAIYPKTICIFALLIASILLVKSAYVLKIQKENINIFEYIKKNTINIVKFISCSTIIILVYILFPYLGLAVGPCIAAICIAGLINIKKIGTASIYIIISSIAMYLFFIHVAQMDIPTGSLFEGIIKSIKSLR